MKRLNRIFAISSVLMIGLAQVPAYAKGMDYDDKIVGLWDVQVTLTSCVSGATLGTFLAMHQYNLGGTGQIVPTSDPTPAALSAHMTIWEHIKKDDYEMTAKMYRFDPDGNYIGWVVIKNQVSIDKEANNYVGTGVAEFFNTAGAFQFSSCPTLVGTRFNG